MKSYSIHLFESSLLPLMTSLPLKQPSKLHSIIIQSFIVMIYHFITRLSFILTEFRSETRATVMDYLALSTQIPMIDKSSVPEAIQQAFALGNVMLRCSYRISTFANVYLDDDKQNHNRLDQIFTKMRSICEKDILQSPSTKYLAFGFDTISDLSDSIAHNSEVLIDPKKDRSLKKLNYTELLKTLQSMGIPHRSVHQVSNRYVLNLCCPKCRYWMLIVRLSRWLTYK